MNKPSRKRSDGLLTIALVDKFARSELDEFGSIKFNLDRVIKKSGVSRSSIYHHFGNRAGLLITLEVQHSIDELHGGMELMREYLLASSNVEDVLGAIEFALAIGNDDDGRRRRRRRIAAIVASEDIPALAEVLTNAQIAGSQHLADTLTMLQDRGLISPAAPVIGIAYWIQSLLVGRILLDMTNDPDLDAKWVETTILALRHLINRVET